MVFQNYLKSSIKTKTKQNFDITINGLIKASKLINNMKNEFLFCPLGGSGEIGMNMNLFGYGQPGDHKWIMVDIG